MDWKSVENEYKSTNDLLNEVEDSVSNISSKIPFDLNSQILFLKNTISQNLKQHENLLKIKQKEKKIKEIQAKSKKLQIPENEVKPKNSIFPFTDIDFFDQISNDFH